MRIVVLMAALFAFGGCAHDPCLTGFDLGVTGGEQFGGNLDVRAGGVNHALFVSQDGEDGFVAGNMTLHFDTTGACRAPGS